VKGAEPRVRVADNDQSAVTLPIAGRILSFQAPELVLDNPPLRERPMIGGRKF